MQNVEAFKELLSSPKKIVVIPHYKPDADALGSCLGWAGILKKKGHHVQVISPTDYPIFLKWMKGEDEVLVFQEERRLQIERQVQEADLLFCVDFSGLGRIGELGKMVEASEAVKVIIDHHLEPEGFADYLFWSTQAAATAELVYELTVQMGDRGLIDKDIAECLYAGINTDTGSFKHSNTTKNVHLVVAELIDLGADTSKVGNLIYDTNSLSRLKLMGYALSKKLVVLKRYKTAYLSLSKEELLSFHTQTGDTEGLVNYALSLKGVVFAALITEREDGVKLSLRSKGSFSANEVARDHFSGGGHRNAAGGRSELDLKATVEKFESVLPLYLKQLNNVN
ncbi:MAG: bifunctional oligoribonuclease/PAP phosphatase NrnA [Cytophagales bacterium]|nr:bifunctional oligoribonuclease/PAP phosphatase NrnA [Cytophagales bacterium]